MRQHEQPRRLASLFLRRIERHRRSALGQTGACRFEPSCSHYAEELLHTRVFPVALVLIIGRVLRCNPLTNPGVADTARRDTRRRLRPNTIPTLFSVLALSGLVVVATAGIASAVGVTNGCTASINGHDPAQLTSDHPLVVHKGESVSVTGTVPPSVASLPKNQITSNTHIDVSIIGGVFGVSSSDHPGHGPSWGGTQNVDKYLKYGVGLYHVTGVASGTPGWSCDGDGYVQLKDGNPLGKPVGAGATALAVVGGIGALLSSRAQADSASYDEPLIARNEDDEYAESEATAMVMGDPGYEGMAGFGCLMLILIAIGGAFLGKDVAASAVGAAAMRPSGIRRIWAHGHPIAGFLSGLLLGIGITVLMQQFAVWPLTIITAIVFPVVVALICAIRAYLGRPYKVAARPTAA
ncbi:MAG: putative rane protein insertion efficiency factor [Frankiaceae bacterium]|nr:putative rane protein insertion efficiency factor [Frankiaceae bacterium]